MTNFKFILEFLMLISLILTFIFYYRKTIIAIISSILLFVTLGIGIALTIVDYIGAA